MRSCSSEQRILRRYPQSIDGWFIFEETLLATSATVEFPEFSKLSE